MLMVFHIEDPSGIFHEMEVGVNPEKTRINGKQYDFVDKIYSNDIGDKGIPEREGIFGWAVMMETDPEDLVFPEGNLTYSCMNGNLFGLRRVRRLRTAATSMASHWQSFRKKIITAGSRSVRSSVGC